MALDRLRQLIPGGSVSAGDNIGERTRKGIVSGVVLQHSTTFGVTAGTVVIAENIYAYAGIADIDSIDGVAVTTGSEVYLLTPAPIRKVDPFSVFQTGVAPLVTGVVVNAGQTTDKLVIKYLEHDGTPANQKIWVNGVVYGASTNTVTAQNATLGLDVVITLASGRDASFVGREFTGFVRDNVIAGANSAGDSLLKTVAFTIGNTPRGEEFTTKGMLIAGERVEYRDKSIYLGRITGANTVDTTGVERFTTYTRG